MKRTLILALCVTAAKVNYSQPSNAFSLTQAIEYSIKYNSNYLNAELDLKSADYKRKEITGIGLPQINGSIDIKDYLDLPTSLLPGQFFGAPAGTYIPVKFGTKYNSTAGVSASQLLFSSDYIFGLKASKEFMNLSQINVNRSKSEMAAQISKAYYNVIINKERVKLLKANIARIKKIYEDTKALNEQGFVELIDAERLEVSYNNLLTEEEKVNKLIGMAETLLKFQMGYKLSDPIVLTDSLNTPEPDESILNLTKVDISKRPDYLLLKSQQNLYDIDLKRLKWGYLPTLAAYGSYQYNAQRQKFDFFDTNQKWFKIALVGATLNLNIFDGLQRNYKIQQAKITSQKNANTLRNIEMAAEMEATMASTSYYNAYATVKTQKKNMDLASHVYEVAQKKYKQGVGSNIEVITAETSLKEAQTNYYNAIYDMLVAKVDYQRATGTLIK